MPLLGAMVGAIAGCWVPLLDVRCHCWVACGGVPLGGVGVHFGGLDVVPLVAAIAGCDCWAAIAGLALLGAIAGWRCRCWLPLLGGMWPGAMVRCHCWVPCGKVPLLGAIVRCHCCMLAIAGCHVSGCGVIGGCHGKVPLLGAIGTQLWRGCCRSWVPLMLPFLGARVPYYGAIAGCQCKVPWSAGRHGQVPYLGAMW